MSGLPGIGLDDCTRLLLVNNNDSNTAMNSIGVNANKICRIFVYCIFVSLLGKGKNQFDRLSPAKSLFSKQLLSVIIEKKYHSRCRNSVTSVTSILNIFGACDHENNNGLNIEYEFNPL